MAPAALAAVQPNDMQDAGAGAPSSKDGSAPAARNAAAAAPAASDRGNNQNRKSGSMEAMAAAAAGAKLPPRAPDNGKSPGLTPPRLRAMLQACGEYPQR